MKNPQTVNQHSKVPVNKEAIANRAGVTKAMIYYYFKTKEGLYRAVLEYLFSELTNREEKHIQEAIAFIMVGIRQFSQ